MILLKCLSWASESEFFDQPQLVVTIHEVSYCRPDLFDGAVMAAVDDLLFDSPIEPFRHPVGLRFGNKRKAWGDSPELDLVLEMFRKVLGAVIHPQYQTSGRSGTNRTKSGLDSHGERLQGGKPVAMLGDMPADAFGIPMLDGGKQPAPAFFLGEDPGAVRAPHDVRGRGNDLAGVFLGLALDNAMGRQQVVLPHEAQDPLAADFDPFDEPQAAPDLAVPLADEGGGFQIGLDEGKHLVVSERSFRATLKQYRRDSVPGDTIVERRAGHFLDTTDALDAVGFARKRGDRSAHLFDLLGAKG